MVGRQHYTHTCKYTHAHTRMHTHTCIHTPHTQSERHKHTHTSFVPIALDIKSASTDLERWRDKILQKPELDFRLGVFDQAQDHDAKEALVKVARSKREDVDSLIGSHSVGNLRLLFLPKQAERNRTKSSKDITNRQR